MIFQMLNALNYPDIQTCPFACGYFKKKKKKSLYDIFVCNALEKQKQKNPAIYYLNSNIQQ